MKPRLHLVLVALLSIAPALCPLPSSAEGADDHFLPSEALLRSPFAPEDLTRFAHPDRVFYPEIWIDCMCGNLSEHGITADLEAIADAGFNGVQLFFGNRGTAWPGVEQIHVLSPEWEAFVRHASEEAHRLGLRFTLQNCAGWAMAGGPWIEPADAMRHLVMSRTDVQGGKVDVMLPVDAGYLIDWRDYRDVKVLAFPTPKDDTGEALVSAAVESSYSAFPWHRCVEGQGGGVLPPTTADAPHTAIVTLAEPSVVRTMVLSSVQTWNHQWCYAPGVHIKVEALADDGSSQTVFDDDMPQSCWQDEMSLSLALSEAPATTRWRVSIVNSHNMSLNALRLLSAARKNNWESECARTLRGLMPCSDSPMQDENAYIHKERLLDLTAAMTPDGHLCTSLPDGNWTILRLGHVNTGKKNAPAPPEATGFECNKYDVEGARKHFAGYIGKLVDGPLAGGGLDGMLLDSWECEYQTWTKDMEDEFRLMHGYDLQPYLPALFGWVVDDAETTWRFLRDWRALINRLSVERFYGEIARLGHEKGLTVTYETAAGDVFPADIMEYFKYADIPMCEFWSHPTDEFIGSLAFKPIKPTVSAGRLYGKPRIAAEAFTSWATTWDESLRAIRDVANHNLIEGATYLIYQAYTHNPRPDELVPGTSFGDGICTPFLRSQTWWHHMHAFNDCTARTSFMLERGLPVSDVLWYLGDEIDHKPDQCAPFPEGFKYDYCNPDVLLNRLSVKDGKLKTPEGITYQLLWLPQTRRMLPETLERLVELVNEGAILVGDRPSGLATLADESRESKDESRESGVRTSQQRFDHAVSKLWGNNAKGRHDFGRGAVLSGMSIDEAIATLGLQPDVVADGVQWLHRTVEGADWFFVCPQRGKTFNGTIRFHAQGEVTLWNPVSGAIEAAESAPSGDGYTEVILSLAQAETCFVVFNHTNTPKSKGHPQKGTTHQPVAPIQTVPLTNEWNVTFPDNDELIIDSLCSWTEMNIPDETRAFSGTVKYETALTMKGKTHLKRGARYVLDLGQVEQVAKVFVNGKEVQTLWTAPYCVDITSYLHYGSLHTNELAIEVTNTWFNRLLWDVRLPDAERKTWTAHWPSPAAEYRPSGLLGPVLIKSFNE